MAFKPLLAPGESPATYPDFFKKLQYPLMASPKYDGIRCIVKYGHCLSRSGKVLPSLQVQKNFRNLQDFDGELIIGSPENPDVYNITQSHVMSEDKPGDIHFHVFDYTHQDWLNRPFFERYEELDYINRNIYSNLSNVHTIPHEFIETYDELIAYENRCLEKGFEGIMMRNPISPYKQGRGTFREGIIYKLKRFTDSEAIIVGFDEKLVNENILQTDELGYAKRSTAKAGMVRANTLGAFRVIWNEMYLDIAPGSFTHEERERIWNNQSRYLGKFLKFRYFEHGIKDKPRFPRAIGFRDQMDI